MTRHFMHTFDLVAYYEPRADFALSANVRKALDDLAGKHTRHTMMMGRHSGKPVLHTDIQGISVGTRIEVGRLAFRSSKRVEIVSEMLRLFKEASELEISSGPIQRVTASFPKSGHRPEQREAIRLAFRDVFDRNCCFLCHGRTHLEIGYSVVHQALLQHVREDGPFHSIHRSRVDAVQSELQKQPGRYENHRFFTRPIRRTQEVPEVEFCYSGECGNTVVEAAMAKKTDERLIFVSAEQIRQQSDAHVSLADYMLASQRFGSLWVMQGDVIRSVDRYRFGVMNLFTDDAGEPVIDKAFSWEELHERQKRCQRISRSSRNSSVFLDICLHHLEPDNQ